MSRVLVTLVQKGLYGRRVGNADYQEGAMVQEQITINQWLQLIRAEYQEVPGLHLTKPQVQRLWGLDAATCDALLSALEDVKFLRKTQNNGYVRRDLGC
jgi:hypothetical protein